MRPQNLEKYLELNAPADLAPMAKALLEAANEVQDMLQHVSLEETGENPSGEQTKEFDRKAHLTFLGKLQGTKGLWGVLSEEQEEIEQFGDEGEYMIAIDPIDGSSVVESGFAVGTMVGIYKQKPGDNLYTGRNLVAAMYFVYGNGMFTGLSFGNGLHIFKKSESGEFAPVRSFVKLSGHSHIAALGGFDTMAYVEGYKDLAMKLSRDQFKLRYSGSLAADMHLLFMTGGGIFVHHSKKLRLLYECAPVAFLLMQAGGHSTNGMRQTLSLETLNPHETTLFLGGTKEVVDMATSLL